MASEARQAGAGAGPLVIVGVVAAYLTTLALSARAAAANAEPGHLPDGMMAPSAQSDTVAA